MHSVGIVVDAGRSTIENSSGPLLRSTAVAPGAARVDGNQFFRFDHHRNSPPTPTLRTLTAARIKFAQYTHLGDQENSRSWTARSS
jgi:hypothetical protein